MKYVNLGKSNLKVSSLCMGNMRLPNLQQDEANSFIMNAIEQGVNFFDHADIYGAGKCEEMFGEFLKTKAISRDKIYIQSKCGIVPGVMFDFSKEHIIKSVEGSLERLKTDYLDVLLLHRPDALVEPEEVNEAFLYLKNRGMVRNFGVSNQNPMQMELLKKHLEFPIVANQLQLSIAHNNMISNGINVNMTNESSVMRDGSVLDYCRLNDITIQPWSPFQFGFFKGVFVDNEQFPELNKKLAELAEKYNTTKNGIVIAWLNRHPANFVTILGTMNLCRFNECVNATDIVITREEWYEIYKSAGNVLP